jgi:hypothetical protein
VQGTIYEKEDMTLGAFFDTIKVPFDSNKILNMTNGDPCEKGPGMLKMYVNSLPREDYRNYVLSATENPEKQVIKLVFKEE